MGIYFISPLPLKGNQPVYSLEGLILKLKLQYFGLLMWRAISLEKTWERLKAKEVGGRRWDGSIASPTQWTWVWVSSRSRWWSGRPGMLQSMGSQRVRHDWVTELIYIYSMWLRWQRICLQCCRPWFNSWVGKIPRRWKWQPTPVFLPGEFHRQRSLAGYSPLDHKELITEWLTHTHRWIKSIKHSNNTFWWACWSF